MFDKPNIVYTKRLCLQPFSHNDEKTLSQLLTNAEIGKTFMLPNFKTQEEVLNLVNRFKDLSQSNQRFVFGIYLQSRLIGFINDVGIEDGVIELGYVIHPDHQNRGYATEVLEKSIEVLFEMGFTTVKTGAFEENIKSVRVMEKCGMTKTDQTEEIQYNGKTHKCIYYLKSNRQ